MTEHLILPSHGGTRPAFVTDGRAYRSEDRDHLAENVPAVAAMIEANINGYLLSFARLPGASVVKGGDVTLVDSGYPSAIFNSIVAARFRPDAADARIASVLAHFRRVGRPVTWHVGPTTTPSVLGALLLAHGMAHVADEPGMAVALDHMQADEVAPPGLTIEAVGDERGLVEWVDVWLSPVPKDGRRLYSDALRHRVPSTDSPWCSYVGRLEGRPVATAELFTDSAAGVASIQNVVTLPEVRRRGIGTAMTWHVLREARRLGCQVAVLTASPDGLGVYRRLGFRRYCRFRKYEWAPSDVADAGRQEVVMTNCRSVLPEGNANTWTGPDSARTSDQRTKGSGS